MLTIIIIMITKLILQKIIINIIYVTYFKVLKDIMKESSNSEVFIEVNVPTEYPNILKNTYTPESIF